MTVTVKTEALLNWKAENCFEFLVKNHPTCKLYSQDGFFVKCHKEVLIQTPFLRKLLKDSSNCSHFSEQVDIFFPFVNHRILEQINIFLYIFVTSETLGFKIFKYKRPWCRDGSFGALPPLRLSFLMDCFSWVHLKTKYKDVKRITYREK